MIHKGAERKRLLQEKKDLKAQLKLLENLPNFRDITVGSETWRHLLAIGDRRVIEEWNAGPILFTNTITDTEYLLLQNRKADRKFISYGTLVDIPSIVECQELMERGEVEASFLYLKGLNENVSQGLTFFMRAYNGNCRVKPLLTTSYGYLYPQQLDYKGALRLIETTQQLALQPRLTSLIEEKVQGIQKRVYLKEVLAGVELWDNSIAAKVKLVLEKELETND